MSAEGRFSLDTNILIYTIDLDAGDRHEMSSRLVELVGHPHLRRNCVLTTQVLAEFYHVVTRKRLLKATRAKASVHDWIEIFAIVNANEESLVDAVDATEKHRMSFWDAMLWAAVRRAGCSAIISENMQHGRHLGGVEIINPFVAGAAARLRPLGVLV